MKKDDLIQHKITQAWKRTAVFLKLIRHKKANGNLKGEYDEYVYAISGHFRDTEGMLIKESYKESSKEKRGGDRRSQRFKKGMIKMLEGKRVAFNKYEYDDQIRAIIKKIESRYTSDAK